MATMALLPQRQRFLGAPTYEPPASHQHGHAHQHSHGHGHARVHSHEREHDNDNVVDDDDGEAMLVDEPPHAAHAAHAAAPAHAVRQGKRPRHRAARCRGRVKALSALMPTQVPAHVGDWALLGRIAENTYRVENVRTDQAAVAKLFNMKRVPVESILHEQGILRLAAGHHGIVQLLGTVLSGTAGSCSERGAISAIVTEGGVTDLGTWVERTRGHMYTDGSTACTATTVSHLKRAFAGQMLGAVAFLHGKDIIHNNLTLQNCVVTRHSTVKLVEFGRAELIGSGGASCKFRGTLGYMAPEIFNGRPHGKPADMFSFGVCLYVLTSMDGSRPFRRGSLGDHKCDVAQQRFRAHLHTCPTTLHPVFQDHLFAHDPAQRLTARELQRQAWFQQSASARESDVSSLLSDESEPCRGFSLGSVPSSPAFPPGCDGPFAAAAGQGQGEERDKAMANVRRLAREHLAADHGSRSPDRTLTKHRSLPSLSPSLSPSRGHSPEALHARAHARAGTPSRPHALGPDYELPLSPVGLGNVEDRWAHGAAGPSEHLRRHSVCASPAPRPPSCTIDEEIIDIRASVNDERRELRQHVRQLVHLSHAMRDMRDISEASDHVDHVGAGSTTPLQKTRRGAPKNKSKKRGSPRFLRRKRPGHVPMQPLVFVHQLSGTPPESPVTPSSRSRANRTFLSGAQLQPRNRFQ